NWNDGLHWSDTSNGGAGCGVPTATNPVLLDVNSGGPVTVNVNAAMASLTTTGFTNTLAVGTFDFAVSGAVIHAGGTITVGASSANGVTATGSLTLSATLTASGTSKITVAGWDSSAGTWTPDVSLVTVSGGNVKTSTGP